MKKILLLILTISAITVSSFPVKPYTFSSGTKARSAEVNANYDSLYNWGGNFETEVYTQFLRKSHYIDRDSTLQLISIDTCYVDSLTANLTTIDTATINRLGITTGALGTFTADDGTITALSSTTGTITTLDGTTSTYTTINGTTVNSTTINNTNLINSGYLTTDSLYSDKVEFNRMIIDSSVNTYLYAATSDIASLAANDIDVGNIDIDTINTAVRCIENVTLDKNISITGTATLDTITGALRLLSNLNIDGTLGVTGVSSLSSATLSSTLGVTGHTGVSTITSTGLATLSSTDINGGAIDGTNIGAVSAGTGAFTTLSATGTSTLSTVDINAGAIDATSVGISTPSTGAFTSLSATSTSTLSTVDIDAGNIDGTTIGSASSSAGTFTNVISSTNTVNGLSELDSVHSSLGIRAEYDIVARQFNSGQGLTEIHLQDQNIRSTDSPTFVGVTLSGALSSTSTGSFSNIYTTGTAGFGIASSTRNVQIHGVATSFLAMTNTDAGSTISDGVIFGVDSDESILFYNYEATPTKFWNNGNLNMILEAAGAVTITTTLNAGATNITGNDHAGSRSCDGTTASTTFNSGLGVTEIPVYASGSFVANLCNDALGDCATDTLYYEMIGNMVHITKSNGTTETTMSAGAGSDVGSYNLTNAPAAILPSATGKQVRTNIPIFISNYGVMNSVGTLYYNSGTWYFLMTVNSSDATAASNDLRLIDASFSYKLRD